MTNMLLRFIASRKFIPSAMILILVAAALMESYVWYKNGAIAALGFIGPLTWMFLFQMLFMLGGRTVVLRLAREKSLNR